MAGGWISVERCGWRRWGGGHAAGRPEPGRRDGLVAAPVALARPNRGRALRAFRVSEPSRQEESMRGKVLFVLTSHGDLGDTGRKTGFYLPELTHPLAVVRDAGYDFDLASPKGGEPPMDGVKREDPLNAAFLDDPEMMARVRETIPLDRVKLDDYVGVFFVGGHGTMWDFPGNPAVARVAAGIYEAGGIVAAVCHGPSALVDVRLSDGSYLVAGKEVSAFTNEEEQAVGLDEVVPFLLESKLAEQGAIIRKAPKFEAMVAVAERLVTGQNPASAKGVGEAMVKVMEEVKATAGR